MYLDFTPEQKELRAEIRASLEAVMTADRIASVAGRMEGGNAVKECVQALGAANLLGVGWPKEYGGRGFTALEQFIFFEEAQRVNAPIPLVTLNTVGPTLMVYGTDEQKNRYLPKLARGEWLPAYALTESGSGSDSAAMRTTARGVFPAERIFSIILKNNPRTILTASRWSAMVWACSTIGSTAANIDNARASACPTNLEPFL